MSGADLLHHPFHAGQRDVRRFVANRFATDPFARSNRFRTDPEHAARFNRFATDPERAALVAQAEASIARGSHSFAAASRLFARDVRERAWLLYAWCRAADDMTDAQAWGHARSADRAADPLAVQARLEGLTRAALDGDSAVPPAFAALRRLSREVALPRRWIEDHLEGYALDARGWSPATEHDLLRYCHAVAGTVGRMMALIMDVPRADRDTIDRASDLGIAFQLANIARDIVADGEIGRCYLPAAWLAEAGARPGAAPHDMDRATLASLAARLIALARPYRVSARIGAARLGGRSRLAVLAADAIYGAIGERVVQLGPQAWDRRVRVSAPAKLGLLALSTARAIEPAPAAPRAGLWTPSYP